MDLCTASSLDMKFILDLYQSAFHEQIRKPFSVIERKTAMGSMEILLIQDEGKRCGFAITASQGELVLLDYFAVSDKWRCQGIGSEALLLMKELYSDKQFYLEIEKPDERADDQEERLRRKDFYLKNGMLDTGICIELFGEKMELLASKPGLTFEQCEKLYRELLGPMYQRVVHQIS